MPDVSDWEIKPEWQPKPNEVPFDLDGVLSSVVAVRAEVAADAFTARVLGTHREGHGVVIGDGGLVVTIGYLVTEAETVWLCSATGQALPAHVVAYDQETGFGMVQALGQLDAPIARRGSSAALKVGEPVIVASHGGRRHATNARVVAKREFAGYWEYVLDEGIFTAPPHPSWGGAGLFAVDGTLRGIGSLFVQQALPGGAPMDGNMIVPIDLLEPIVSDMVRFGRTTKPPRPWLGMYTTEVGGHLVVTGLAEGGPAHRAHVQVGDIVHAVAGELPRGLVDLFRRIWALGQVGVEVPLTVLREGQALSLKVHSAARSDFLKTPSLH